MTAGEATAPGHLGVSSTTMKMTNDGAGMGLEAGTTLAIKGGHALHPPSGRGVLIAARALRPENLVLLSHLKMSLSVVSGQLQVAVTHHHPSKSQITSPLVYLPRKPILSLAPRRY
jgi:hypothetical protein